MRKNNKNFLPQQYKKDSLLKINHNYLKEQFNKSDDILNKINLLTKTCDFTLGKEVDKFEKNIQKLTNSKYAIGVGSGTDAISLSLKALEIGHGDEVITTPYTFYATVGAIVSIGAKPVFVDVKEDYNIDENKIVSAITNKTKAIVPVHWSGLLCNMKEINKIAKKYDLSIVEDACHAIKAELNSKKAGFYSNTACYSMHPLKNLNVWGDGGFVTTNSKKIYEKICLLRNHGLINRDTCKIFAGNSRLDTLQAIVANAMLKKINLITKKRITNALYYDKHLSDIDQITIPKRSTESIQVFHIYVIKAKQRDKLKKYLISKGIDAKIHYPLLMHLQPAAKKLGYKRGSFPIAEKLSKNIFSLPVHEFITKKQMNFVIKQIKNFYK